jgi:GT2 family glycosyltransferase/glycosyltransferase involved in cell wall biosynthesis
MAAWLQVVDQLLRSLSDRVRPARTVPQPAPILQVQPFAAYLPSQAAAWPAPTAVRVAVVCPVYRGLDETRRCLASVLAHRHDMPAEIIVIDDCSPEPGMNEWLRGLAAEGLITLLRNDVNRGFVASVNRGVAAAGDRDVVLLNSDTEVPADWLSRLAGHAYAFPRIGTVTPFSNNATICSWPGLNGGPLPAGRTVADMDTAFLAANRGRQVNIPTAVGFCMYIRRDCIETVGLFDEATFGRGYGEENDFCMRATAAGWQHVLACDTFVFHAGETSFGRNSPERVRAWPLLIARYPHYAAAVARHIEADEAAASRFAATAALFRQAAEPTILVVMHSLGGGTDRHVRDVQAAVGPRANFLRLEHRPGGLAMSAPGLAGHPQAVFGFDQVDELVAVLQSCDTDRVHVHHWLGYDSLLRVVLDRLGVPFDVTIHDYFSVCPQINLLPTPTSQYCGEPEAATCNACIAGRPQFGATDITDWRTRHAWLLNEAERVICPSADARERIARYAPHARLLTVPHEPVRQSSWHVRATMAKPGEPVRIGVIGVISEHKGLDALAAAIEAADPREFEFVVIGVCDPKLPRHLRHRVQESGPYEEADLQGLLAAAQLHVAWFPATGPETYSYTLSAAIEAGLPIVAPAMGAFPERLAARPLTWLVKSTRDGSAVLNTFMAVRSVLLTQPDSSTGLRTADPFSYYPGAYLAPLPSRNRPRPDHLTSLRRKGLTSVLVLPDRCDNGTITPCGFIRLVQPFDLLAALHTDILVEVVDLEAALTRDADVLVCQRHVTADLTKAEQLIEHCRARGIKLIYDLDDDLVSIRSSHPEAARLQGLATIVKRFVESADRVWFATPELQRRLGFGLCHSDVVANRHDERIWRHSARRSVFRGSESVRIVSMRTATHDEELDFLQPIAERLEREFSGRVRFEILGVASREQLASCFQRVTPEEGTARQSYPGFVAWFCRQHWDIAVAPLIDTPFNRCKSAIKLLDYAALALPVVASHHVEYESAFGGDHGVHLVPNTLNDWCAALSLLIRDADARHREGQKILDHYRRNHILDADRPRLLRACVQQRSERLPGAHSQGQ